MFSATKARWLLDHADDRRRADSGELCLGTVDSWLLSRFGAGSRRPRHRGRQRRAHPAARTSAPGSGIPRCSTCSPSPRPSCRGSSPSTGPFPAARAASPRCRTARRSPRCSGDSHAALFAHAGWRPGMVKATYGTGSSVMGGDPAGTDPGEGLCLTVAWQDDEPAVVCGRGQHPFQRRDARLAGRAVGSTPAEFAALAADADAATASTSCRRSAAWARRGGTDRGRDDQRSDPGHRTAPARAGGAGVDRVPGARTWSRPMDRVVPVDVLLADGGPPPIRC